MNVSVTSGCGGRLPTTDTSTASAAAGCWTTMRTNVLQGAAREWISTSVPENRIAIFPCGLGWIVNPTKTGRRHCARNHDGARWRARFEIDSRRRSHDYRCSRPARNTITVH